MVEWSRAFGDVPIYLHAADRRWVMRPDPAIEFWEGETKALHDGLTLIRCGGHFEGGTVLHWPAGAEGQGVLLSGDILQVCQDRRHVSFMYSYPNYIPLSADSVRRVVAAVEPFAFDRIYGFMFDLVIKEDAKAAVSRSADATCERSVRKKLEDEGRDPATATITLPPDRPDRAWSWPLGLGSRRYRPQICRAFVAAYAGDTLWALVAFLGIGLLLPRASTWRVAAAGDVVLGDDRGEPVVPRPLDRLDPGHDPGRLVLGSVASSGATWPATPSASARDAVDVLVPSLGEFESANALRPEAQEPTIAGLRAQQEQARTAGPIGSG